MGLRRVRVGRSYFAALGVSVALAVTLAGCGDGDQSAEVATSTQSTATQSTSSPEASSPTSVTDGSVAPSQAVDATVRGPGTVCESTQARRIVINRGHADCAQAVRIISAIPGVGEAAPPDIEGWSCGRDGGYGNLAMSGYMYRCDRGGDQVLSQDDSVPVAANWVDNNDYYRASDQVDGQSGFYFQSPTGYFACAIIGTPGAASAGCHGQLPSAAPTINQHPDFQTANTIDSLNGEHGQLRQRGDPQYQFISDVKSRVLPYNQPIFVSGYTCTVDRDAGTTCRNFDTGHGFTVNRSTYKLF